MPVSYAGMKLPVIFIFLSFGEGYLLNRSCLNGDFDFEMVLFVGGRDY